MKEAQFDNREKIIENEGTNKEKNRNTQMNCNDCSYSTRYPSMIKRHTQVTHEGVRFKCKTCSKEFRDQMYLKRHTEIAHLGYIQKKIPCDYCAYSNISKLVMKQHINSMHLGVVYDCSHCEKTFSRLKAKEMHIQKIHVEEKHKCTKCEFVAITKYKLQYHNKIDHEHFIVKPKKKRKSFAHEAPLQVKQKVCKHCNFETNSSSNLKEHRLSKHVSFFCGDCEFKTDYGTLLKQHIDKIHNGKVYQCKHCDFTADYYQKWLYHEKTHTQVELKCKYCDASYNHDQALKSHERIIHNKQHTKVRKLTHKCQLCDFAGKLSRNLKVHKLQVHGIVEKIKFKPRRNVPRQTNKDRRRKNHTKLVEVKIEDKDLSELITTQDTQTNVKLESDYASLTSTVYDKPNKIKLDNTSTIDLMTNFDKIAKDKIEYKTAYESMEITKVKIEFFNNSDKKSLEMYENETNDLVTTCSDTINNMKRSTNKFLNTFETQTKENPNIFDNTINCTICIYLGELTDLKNMQILQDHVKTKHGL